MVVDIQGVGNLWTDPQIHSLAGDDYGDGNGIKARPGRETKMRVVPLRSPARRRPSIRAASVSMLLTMKEVEMHGGVFVEEREARSVWAALVRIGIATRRQTLPSASRRAMPPSRARITPRLSSGIRALRGASLYFFRCGDAVAAAPAVSKLKLLKSPVSDWDWPCGAAG